MCDAHKIWNKLENIYEHNLYEHVYINLNESNNISPDILVVESVVDTNQESEKIELSISEDDSNLNLTHDKVKEAITNDTENS